MPQLVIKALIAFSKTKTGKRIMMYLLKKTVSKAFDTAMKSQPVQEILSDEDMKDIKQIASRGAPYSLDEVALLSLAAGQDNSGYALNDDDSADDSVIDSYAKHLHNYLYNYKDEAKNVDPSIDPSQDQIGIMAQDLEKVNPACVNTLPNGIKTVDTGRLALMNAGAIADLARRLDAIGG